MTSAVRMTIPLMKPTFDTAEEEAVVRVLRSGWVTQGPVVAQFEQAVADYVGAKHAIAVTSATTALQATLQALNIGVGDEVICPSYTYIATPNSVYHAGAIPVFVDIDPLHWAIDPNAIEARITPRTKAIMAVHMGWTFDLDAVYAIADRHGLVVIEDAAPAIGAKYHGRMVGNSAGPVVFSFHPRKIITTGEGGVITTNDDALADALRLDRHHHMSVSDMARHQGGAVVFESYEDVGYNFRMTDLQAAVGVAQMEKLDSILAERRRIAARYDEAFRGLEAVRPLLIAPDTVPTYQSYMLWIEREAKLDRNSLMAFLQERGVTTRRGIMSSHLEPAYVERMGRLSLPVSEAVSANTIILPLFHDMTDAEMGYVVDAVREGVHG